MLAYSCDAKYDATPHLPVEVALVFISCFLHLPKGFFVIQPTLSQIQNLSFFMSEAEGQWITHIIAIKYVYDKISITGCVNSTDDGFYWYFKSNNNRGTVASWPSLGTPVKRAVLVQNLLFFLIEAKAGNLGGGPPFLRRVLKLSKSILKQSINYLKYFARTIYH